MPGGRTREVTLDPGDLCGHSGQKTRARRSLPGPDAGHPLQGNAGSVGLSGFFMTLLKPDGRQHRGRDMIAALERHFLSGESRRRRSVNAELLAPQRNDCRENIQRLGVGWRRRSYLGLDGRDQAPAHLLAEVQVHVPVPL